MGSLLQRRIDAALGRVSCDLVIQDAKFLDVFSCQWKVGDIGIIDGTIVALEPGLRGHRTVEAKGKNLVPGFIDAHVHVESSLLTPSYFERAVLPRGTTTAICDPHELANVMGVKGIRYFLESASTLSMDLRVMLSSCVPATGFETNGGGEISADELVPLIGHPKALGLAEMMNFPGVLHADPEVLRKLTAFQNKRIDGHAPLVRGKELSAYAAAGITSCHESSELDEAREKISKGMAVWIREGSVAKDLTELAPLLSLATSTSVGFCTDDRNPLDIIEEGHVDYLIRRAIQAGVVPEVAYRAASWSVARHYGLESGSLNRVGAIAPGYRADLVLLEDLEACAVSQVWVAGKLASEIPVSKSAVSDGLNTIRAALPEARALEGPAGRVHVIGVRPGKILTDHRVMEHDAPGVARFSVLERYGKGNPPANGYAFGFGENFRGAIASSVGHDSHNLAVVGSNSSDMRIALGALMEKGGGFCVSRDGAVLARLELPFGGLMSLEEPATIADSLRKLRKATRSIGCELPEPFLQLAFLCLPVIPSLKLTDQGLVDVERFQMISVRA